MATNELSILFCVVISSVFSFYSALKNISTKDLLEYEICQDSLKVIPTANGYYFYQFKEAIFYNFCFFIYSLLNFVKYLASERVVIFLSSFGVSITPMKFCLICLFFEQIIARFIKLCGSSHTKGLSMLSFLYGICLQSIFASFYVYSEYDIAVPIVAEGIKNIIVGNLSIFDLNINLKRFYFYSDNKPEKLSKDDFEKIRPILTIYVR